MDPDCNCCEVNSMCGYSLRHGVIFVGIVTSFISLITLAHAVICVGTTTPGEKGFNGSPMLAVDMIFGLYSMSISLYQILISLLLIWQAARTKGDICICSLWHVSHITILSLYCLLFTAKTSMCFIAKQYYMAVAIAVIGILYKALFIYFSVIVTSFSYTIAEFIYY